MLNSKNKIVFTRLGFCQMCKEVEAKYTCPGCEVSTCSLVCVNGHKKELKCDGIRSKVNYVPAKKMNELQLLSDYRLLEELDRCVESCSRDNTRKITRKNAPLPKHLQYFRKAVSQRGTRIYFMPKTFSKHKDNTTLLNWQNKLISWRLEVTFLHAQQYQLIVEKCSEDTVVEVILDKCLKVAMERKKEYKKHFEAYLASKNDVIVLLKAEKIPEARNRFYELDKAKTLKENLVGKRIIEYPQLYITLKGFYSVSEVAKGTNNKSSKKLDSLLLSNYSLDQKNGQSNDESSSEDEEPSKKKVCREKKNPNVKQSSSQSDDSDDAFDEAFSVLDTGGHKELLSCLYKSAIENPNP